MYPRGVKLPFSLLQIHVPSPSHVKGWKNVSDLLFRTATREQWPIEQNGFITTMRLPILQLLCWLFFFGKASHHPGLSAPLQPRFGSLWLLVFLKAKIAIESEEIYECGSHTVHKLSQRRLTADWLPSWESDCSWMRSKVSCGCQVTSSTCDWF
jgi:hypothetical protein